MAIASSLLELLVDPLTKESLALVQGADGSARLFCEGSGLYYPIRDDIPFLLADDAELENGSAATVLVAEIRERISGASGANASGSES